MTKSVEMFGQETPLWPDHRAGKRRLAGLMMLLALAVVVAALWWIPAIEVQRHGVQVTTDQYPALVNDFRRTWATVAGGIAVVIGLWFTWQQVELRRHGQVTDRFSKAVDQLGSHDLQVRIGGIYALERIAQDSARDHWPVMEVLTAFVRERTRDAELPDRRRHTPNHPMADVQAALTVIGRRDSEKDPENQDIDLSGANLTAANLRNASLEGAELDNANLQRAWLGGANLRDGWLLGADLRNAVLFKTDFRNTYLRKADLREPSYDEKTDFRGAHLDEAQLTEDMIDVVRTNADTVLPESLQDSDQETASPRDE